MLSAMSKCNIPSTSPTNTPVQDRGAQARQQLLAQATRLFAAKGYAAASTREICQAAGVNIAAIRYYFGSKEGLYRAALTEPIHFIASQFGRFDDPELPFAQAIRQVLAPMICLNPQDDYKQQITRLHLRETLEPSAIFREVVRTDIQPLHNLLTGVLARHCKVAEVDTDIHQLAFAMLAMANDYCISREYMKLLAPAVLDRPDAANAILDRLVAFCSALLDAERARRQPDPNSSSRRPEGSPKS